jgi:hypothetical protein
MTDDIVKYLRLSRTRFNRNDEAADEIERLRRTIVQLKGQEMCDPNDPCEMCKGSQ